MMVLRVGKKEIEEWCLGGIMWSDGRTEDGP